MSSPVKCFPQKGEAECANTTITTRIDDDDEMTANTSNNGPDRIVFGAKVKGEELMIIGNSDEYLWPIEHPSEPPQEDRPVECPLPRSSSSLINIERICTEKPAEPQLGATRKRHHSFAHGDHNNRMAPLKHPFPTQATMLRASKHI